jgi:hypothetical protein
VTFIFPAGKPALSISAMVFLLANQSNFGTIMMDLIMDIKAGDKTMLKITGYIEKDIETGLYVAVVPGIPGAHTQADTLDELQKNLKEVVELCLIDD